MARAQNAPPPPCSSSTLEPDSSRGISDSEVDHAAATPDNAAFISYHNRDSHNRLAWDLRAKTSPISKHISTPNGSLSNRETLQLTCDDFDDGPCCCCYGCCGFIWVLRALWKSLYSSSYSSSSGSGSRSAGLWSCCTGGEFWCMLAER